MHDTQSPIPQTAGNALEESCPLVTGNNLLSNKDELPGDNGAQQTPSTPKEKEPKTEALETKSKGPRASTLRTQSVNTTTERRPRGRKNIRRWHKSLERILCHNKKVYVSSTRNACAKMLKQLHNNLLAEHFGFKRTLELIWKYYSWPGMTKQVQQYTTTCLMCRQIKLVCQKKPGKMQPLPMLTKPYLDWSMDFITNLLPSKQNEKAYNSMLVIMCRYTKMARYIPSQKTIDAPKLANIVMRKMILQGAGVLRSIVTNQGSLFMLDYWSVLAHYLGILRNPTIAFYPQFDGQTKRQNQTVEAYLRAYINHLQGDWVQWLLLAKFSYNNSQHASAQCSPFVTIISQDLSKTP